MLPAGETHLAVLTLPLLALSLALCACTSLPVPVSPPDLSGLPVVRAARDGLDISATPVPARHAYWSLFDEQLPAMGVQAVWISIRNAGSMPIDLRRTRWELQYDNGKLRNIGGEDLLTRYYSFRKIRFVTQVAHEQAIQGLARLELPTISLRPTSSIQGFAFFHSRHPPAPTASPAVLVLRGLRISNRRTNIELLLP